VPAKFIDSIDREEPAIVSIESLPGEGDRALVAAAKGRESPSVLKFWSNGTSR